VPKAQNDHGHKEQAKVKNRLPEVQGKEGMYAFVTRSKLHGCVELWSQPSRIIAKRIAPTLTGIRWLPS
jgi:hypothetical protein